MCGGTIIADFLSRNLYRNRRVPASDIWLDPDNFFNSSDSGSPGSEGTHSSTQVQEKQKDVSIQGNAILGVAEEKNEVQNLSEELIIVNILAMSCSTVASENAFSLGSRVVDPFRAFLTPKTVEALVCTSNWLRATPANLYNDPTQEQLQIYAELEELEKDEIINLGGPSPSHSTFVPTTN